MRLYVIDASVVAKWFLPEEHAEEARRLLDGEAVLHAPDYLTLELGHILCKKVRRGELTQARAGAILDVFRGVPVQFHAWGGLFDQAFGIAGQTRRGLYDCLYRRARPRARRPGCHGGPEALRRPRPDCPRAVPEVGWRPA